MSAKSIVAAAFSGALFSVGLAVSGMTRPGKVLAFLDLFGAWDPSLMFVMMGAIAVHATGLLLLRRKSSPIFSTTFHLSGLKNISARLVLGAAIFGIGWGLGGFCPGPALVSMGSDALLPIAFVLAMFAGMGLVRLNQRGNIPSP